MGPSLSRSVKGDRIHKKHIAVGRELQYSLLFAKIIRKLAALSLKKWQPSELWLENGGGERVDAPSPFLDLKTGTN